MKVTQEQLPNCQVGLTIEPDESQVEQALRQAARKIARQYTVPGFRKGKAPYSAVVRAFGKDVLYEQVVEDMGDKLYKQALEETGLEPIAPGTLEDVSFDPLAFHLVLPMPPEVELGDYRSLRVERPEVEVTEDEIQEELETLQKSQAEWFPVEEGTADFGDLITMSVHARAGDDVIIEDDAFELVLEEGGQDFPPGFDQEFIGRKAGEAFSFDLIYPEDWPSSRAGATAHFEVEVHSIKRYDVPELDDDFAPLVGDYDTLDDLKASLRTGIVERRQEEMEHEYANQVLQELIEKADKLDYPPVLVEDAIDRLQQEQERELSRLGFPFEEYLGMTGNTAESYRDQIRGPAEQRLRGDLVLEKLIELEQLEATDEEIEERIDELLEGNEGNQENLRTMLTSEGGRAVMTQEIVRRKSIERMLAIAQGEAPERPAADSTEVGEVTGESGDTAVAQQLAVDQAVVAEEEEETAAETA